MPSSSKHKQRGTQCYGEFTRCILCKLVKMAPLVQMICDTYIQPSIKDPENMKNDDSSDIVYSIIGPNQTVLRDWQKAVVFTIPINWAAKWYSSILGHQIYLALDHKCLCYIVRFGVIIWEQVLALNSEHKDANTLIIYHLHKLMKEQPGLNISIHCDDTDVLLLLLYHVSCGNIQARVWMDSGKVFNNTRHCINISHIILEESNPSPFDAGSMPSLVVILQPPSFVKGNSELWTGWRKFQHAWKHWLPLVCNRMFHIVCCPPWSPLFVQCMHVQKWRVWTKPVMISLNVHMPPKPKFAIAVSFRSRLLQPHARADVVTHATHN